jgi:hypothetical protein
MTAAAMEGGPDFVIVGAQRAGTTSLYNYLVQHPRILPARRKEVHFFDLNAFRGRPWYARFFPDVAERGDALVGEATPYYLFHPLALKRLRAACPAAKLIVLLRDPVERALSHYFHERRLGTEDLPLAHALELESLRLEGEAAKIRRDGRYNSFNHMHYSYVSRGHYKAALEALFALFPREQVAVVKSEALYADPATTVADVVGFLGLDPAPAMAFTPYNAARREPVDEGLYRQLRRHFDEANAGLTELAGEAFVWEEAGPETGRAGAGS